MGPGVCGGLLLGQFFRDLFQCASLSLWDEEDDEDQQDEANGGVQEHHVGNTNPLCRGIINVKHHIYSAGGP